MQANIQGVEIISTKEFFDNRGSFNKLFSTLENSDIDFNLKEMYFNTSNKDVLRGMHLQNKPYDLNKIIYCFKGKILDVLLDLRTESPTYLCSFSIELNQNSNKIIYIPKGVAHGFLSLEDNSKLLYLTDNIYSEKQDTGVKWDSFGFDWPVKKPIISNRDNNLNKLEEWKKI
jgi:dTDP-4-dehydrorhamnose 3,5-epimerase/CDP-3, 6-dideoxy-D-glycero-D-glycero-4-hexulose-5-epimerase